MNYYLLFSTQIFHRIMFLFAEMNFIMHRLVNYKKIFYSVVRFITVYVMNVQPFHQLHAVSLLPNKSMFPHITTLASQPSFRYPYLGITKFIYDFTALEIVVSRMVGAGSTQSRLSFWSYGFFTEITFPHVGFLIAFYRFLCATFPKRITCPSIFLNIAFPAEFPAPVNRCAASCARFFVSGFIGFVVTFHTYIISCARLNVDMVATPEQVKHWRPD